MNINIVGQKQLISKLDKYTLSSFPHAVIINGKLGSGKHLICNYIVNKFNCNSVNVDSDTDINSIILGTIQNASIKFYLIEANFLSEKNQNALLKLAEEPLNNTYLIMMTNSLNNIIPTMKSRCTILNMDMYSKEELSQFTDDRILIDMCETPGQIEVFKQINVEKLLNEINLMYDKIKTMSLSVIFQLSNKIGFTDKDKDKLSYKYFIIAMIYVIINKVRVSPNLENYKAYMLSQKFYNNCNLQCDKKRLYEKFLMELMRI